LDPRAIDPKTGVYISLVQSPNLCFPFKVVVASDTKSLYKERIADFFKYFKNIKDKQVGDYPAGTFDSVSPQDGSSLWKALDRGGACKVKKEFCPYCACRSAKWVQPRVNKCQHCILKGRANCYHWDVGDKTMYANLQSNLDQLKASHAFLGGDPEILAKPTMCLAPDQAIKDITNIEYLPTNDVETPEGMSRPHFVRFKSLPPL
jgi:ribosomal protein L37AE/L43A